MRILIIILLILSFGYSDGQQVINSHVRYRGFVQNNLLLDLYPGAAAAYSLRKLDKDYTGSAIRVRKDTTGQPEQDIGFLPSGELDTVSLKSFLNQRSGFVVTWYDQSGNSRNLTESTQANQARIANAGVIDRENGKPYIRFDGTNDRLALAADLSLTNQSIFSVTRLNQNYTSASSPARIWQSDTTVNTITTADVFALGSATATLTNERVAWLSNLAVAGPNIPYGVGQVTNDLNTGQYIFTALYNFTNGNEGIVVNGSVQTLIPTTNGDFNNTTAYPRAFRRIGSSSAGTGCLNGGYYEFIIYNSVQSSNRTAIENNINDYYNIYWNGDFAGLLDTFPSAAAAYSLRNLDKDYTGALIRVRRSNDNAEMDVFGDYWGNLDTVGLKNFVGANSAFVTTWYDQSGNGRNATQSVQANQPRIALTGVIDRASSKPTIQFNSHLLQVAMTGIDTVTRLQTFSVIQPTAAAAANTTTEILWGYAGGGVSSTASERGISWGSSTGLLSGETFTMFFSNSTINNGRLGVSSYTRSANTTVLHTTENKTNNTDWYVNNGNTNIFTLVSPASPVFANNTAPSNTNTTSTNFWIKSIQGSTNAVEQKYSELIIYYGTTPGYLDGVRANINAYYQIW